MNVDDIDIASLLTAMRAEIDYELLYPEEPHGSGALAMVGALMAGKANDDPTATELYHAMSRETYRHWHSAEQYYRLATFMQYHTVIDRQLNTDLALQVPELSVYAEFVAGVYKQGPAVLERVIEELAAAGESDEGRLRQQLAWLHALAHAGAGFAEAISEIAPDWPVLAPLVFVIPGPFAGESQLPPFCSEQFRGYLERWLKEVLGRALQRVNDEIGQALAVGDVALLDAISAELDQFVRGGPVSRTAVTTLASLWSITDFASAQLVSDAAASLDEGRSFVRNAALVARTVGGLVPALHAEIEGAIAAANGYDLGVIRGFLERMETGETIGETVGAVSREWESMRQYLEPLVEPLANASLAGYFLERIRPLHDVIRAKAAVDAIVAAMVTELEAGLNELDLATPRRMDGWLERLAHVAGGKADTFAAATAELATLWPTLANFPDEWASITAALHDVAPYLIEQVRLVQAAGAAKVIAQASLSPALMDRMVTTMIGRTVAALHGEINRARYAHQIDYLRQLEEALSHVQQEWDQQQTVADISAAVLPQSLVLQLAALARVESRQGAFFLEQIPALRLAVKAALPGDEAPQPPGFRQQHLLDFHLWDAAQQPVLSSLAQDGQMLTLAIRNTSHSDITLDALPEGDQNYHFILRFRKGTLLNPANLRVEGPDAQWRRVLPGPTPAPDVQEIYLCGPAHHVIGAGETRVLELHVVQADPGPGTRTTRVEFVYQSLQRAGRPLTGDREKTLSVVNQKPPLQAAVYQLPMQVGFAGSATILNDGTSVNTLTLQLTNTGPQWRELRFPAPLPERAKIILAFDVGAVGDDAQHRWGMATEDELVAIAPALSGGIDIAGQRATWDVTFTGEAARPQWIFTPALQAPIAGAKAEEQPAVSLAAGQALLLSIGNITSSLPSGPANLYLHCENIPGYPDREYVLIVQKTPLVYGDHLVGIGVAAPSHGLHIAGNDAALRLEGTGSNGAGAKLVFGDQEFVYLHEDEDDKLTVHADKRLALMGGNVGIGTIDPSAKLQLFVADSDETTNLLTVGKGPAPYLTVLNNGNVGIATPAPALHLAIGDDGTGLQQAAENQLALYTGGQEQMRIDQEGKVGIGVGEPSHSLHVVGRDAALRLEGTGANGAGAKLNFGDGDLVYLHEDEDDKLTIHADKRLALTGGEVHVEGTLFVAGEVSSGRDIVVNGGRPTPGGAWDIHEVDCSRFADRTRGFKIRLYAQRNAAPFEVWNYEGHITFEQSGFVNNPDFPGKYRWGVIRWTATGQKQFRLGHPANPYPPEEESCLLGENLINIYSYDPQFLFGRQNTAYKNPRPSLYFAFHPDWAGQVIISDT